MENTLTDEDRRLIKATVPVLAEHGLAITRCFYNLLFEAHPSLLAVFNQRHQAVGEQPQALARAVYAFAVHLDQPEALLPAVERIAHKHASLQVRADQYPIVGHFLLEAMKVVLGNQATPAIVGAWARAYALLASIFIRREAELYQTAKDGPGGWAGLRPLRVARKQIEAQDIVSFYLEPIDGSPLPAFVPGQYITVVQHIPELGYAQPRQYSLSQTPGLPHYRITVKRDAQHGYPLGYVSHRLIDHVQVGDTLEVSPPFGEFRIGDDVGGRPLVFLSGGVGITPFMSMLPLALREKTDRPVLLLHGVRRWQELAFGDELRDWCQKYPSLKLRLFAEEAQASPVWAQGMSETGQVHLQAGRVPEWAADATYYLSGPTGFLQTQRKAVLALGVPAHRVRYEVFGSDVLATEWR